MSNLRLGKYSFGIGDRFARQGRAQLQAFLLAAHEGADVVPVWNKSNREHLTIGSDPAETRAEADAAVQALGWKGSYHVDADHIRLETVNRFIPHCDFYTIDVADWIGKPATAAVVQEFVQRHPELHAPVVVPEIDESLKLSKAETTRIAGKYLLAVEEASRIYSHIARSRGAGTFITEVSMDETDFPQTPSELLVILTALADEQVPLQTIAPKFTGRFNKGVDYVGDLAQFEKEFNEDLAVIAHAIKTYGMPSNLKLSVHSGSDKYSLYGPIRRAITRFGAGVHVKTAGTTWLEEVIGLADAGGEGLELAMELYADALDHIEELCAPYAAVIDIDEAGLPKVDEVAGWTQEQFTAALRHDPSNSEMNPSFRQLMHVGYKMAAKKGARYLDALREFEPYIARNVRTNLYARHIKPLFVGL